MNAAIFLLSAAILAHEVCLLRVLSQAYWHHAASLVVAVALLGFGVAGTVLALIPRLKRLETVAVCAALYALTIPISVRVAHLVDFNILEVGWDATQWLRLLLLEGVFFLPFLFAALAIAVAISLRSREPGGIYAANLLGSGIGSLAAPALFGSPGTVLVIVSVAAAAAASLCRVRWLRLAGLVAAGVVLLLGVFELPMSPFKSFPSAPNKRNIETTYGPLGRVDTAEVASLHFAPGLALMAPSLPESQTAIFLDGHLVGALDHGDRGYLEHTVGAMPFVVTGKTRALMLRVGPELSRAGNLIDPNPDLLNAAGRSANWLDAKIPRGFLEETEDRFDLIVHHVPDLHAAAETPLLTVEGLRLAFQRSRLGLTVSCGLSTPPRSGLKLLLTAEEVTPHVVAVRSADRLCVWLRHEPPEAIRERVIAFCNEHGFDPVRPLAWRFDEPHHITDTPLLAPGHDYPYDVRPVTDARPYFFKFFRWSRLADLFDVERTPFVQWPFVALMVAFLQVTVLGLLLMVGPLWLSRAARAPALTFVALGLGFMLLEMAFLQRAMVRLGSPVFAAAAVLGGFLIGAGLGSRAGERLGRPLRRAALAVVVLAPLGYWLLPQTLAGAAVVCAVVAFPMGMPFPAALSRLETRSAPWALAWNGCASVAAAAAAPLLSSTFGIPLTGAIALVVYALLGLFYRS